MRYGCWLLLVLLLLLSVVNATASTDEEGSRLRIYGPGGPHHVMQECAALFSARHGITVDVVRALPHKLVEGLRSDGDLYYGGAEYMLEQLHEKHPDLLDLSTVENLHPRRIGILVRKGNPLAIDGVEDLGQDHVSLLDVKLENMRHFHGNDHGGRLGNNVRHFAFTGLQGVEAWRDTPEIDAWVTYRTWHLELEEESEFIAIPGRAGLRYTPIALTRETPNRSAALKFIDFLKSAEVRQVFEEHGWY